MPEPRSAPCTSCSPRCAGSAIDGIDEAWAVNGPPGLCVMFARLGAFGPIDLVVSGINPGANVGRAVYHSGTVGAALTARNGNVSGVAVSQAVAGFGVEGQGWDEMIADQHWDTAAYVGSIVVGAVLSSLPQTRSSSTSTCPICPSTSYAAGVTRRSGCCHRGPSPRPASIPSRVERARSPFVSSGATPSSCRRRPTAVRSSATRSRSRT